MIENASFPDVVTFKDKAALSKPLFGRALLTEPLVIDEDGRQLHRKSPFQDNAFL